MSDQRFGRRGFMGGVAGMLAGMVGLQPSSAWSKCIPPGITVDASPPIPPLSSDHYLHEASASFEYEYQGDPPPIETLIAAVGRVNDRPAWGFEAGTFMFAGFSDCVDEDPDCSIWHVSNPGKRTLILRFSYTSVTWNMGFQPAPYDLADLAAIFPGELKFVRSNGFTRVIPRG